MVAYDKSKFYIDFSERDNLTNEEKVQLENIQNSLRPIERIDLLLEFRYAEKITSDDFETMTGTPYNFEH